MKRIVLLAVGIAAFSTGAYAQSNAELIENSLAAAPRRGRDDATVVKWAADHTYTTIKEGTNQIVCYSRADQRDRPPFAVQCTSLANLDRVAQNHTKQRRARQSGIFVGDEMAVYRVVSAQQLRPAVTHPLTGHRAALFILGRVRQRPVSVIFQQPRAKAIPQSPTQAGSGGFWNMHGADHA